MATQFNNYAPGNSSAERIGFNKLSVSTACKSSQRLLNNSQPNAQHKQEH